MYGPKWPFLLMYGSHDMRHRFSQVDRLSTDPRDLGHHRASQWKVFFRTRKNGRHLSLDLDTKRLRATILPVKR